MRSGPIPDARRLLLQAGVAMFIVVAVPLALSVVVSAATHAPRRGAVNVRVNQVGYPTNGAKRAVVLAGRPLRGASWSIAGSSVHGRVGRRLPSWSKRFPYEYS